MRPATYTVLHRFNYGHLPKRRDPRAGWSLWDCSVWGHSGFGVVYKLDRPANYTVLHNFTGGRRW